MVSKRRCFMPLHRAKANDGALRGVPAVGVGAYWQGAGYVALWATYALRAGYIAPLGLHTPRQKHRRGRLPPPEFHPKVKNSNIVCNGKLRVLVVLW